MFVQNDMFTMVQLSKKFIRTAIMQITKLRHIKSCIVTFFTWWKQATKIYYTSIRFSRMRIKFTRSREDFLNHALKSQKFQLNNFLVFIWGTCIPTNNNNDYTSFWILIIAICNNAVLILNRCETLTFLKFKYKKIT